ncbi:MULTISPECIES: MetQ/NlpA family ABC transporter substrate-binding protein [Legionella]|uniref:MetQ/NlpA family lipoprotein n=1 Tax=Legionella septentrionalis TaxID=2498109 RepID=A0A3S0VB14_9GAMM|nr:MULTISPECIES: MetQ/NlpA family ABC transporter substrate-binding protein [Legionella]MCP0914198.1 MetQ/NlpA family ABC transporter substrate-binding protein [Legionella sp. 27cVA30]RUQ89226.1 MetQ/NlpA family lipoprotein [Legionella septentrionalis]RUR00539.1 MetQ/NlpA family lipoprotein [Legionella septentrionalis]RUR11740.1 MetQ/NlpA family lipoprotein [Legionella septentrionalis]RUR17428.1 MetQ/NlpA family lipoprotein [Legionella septentrionalis]
MRIVCVFSLLLALVACSKPSPNTLTIGTISGPETELVEVAQEVGKNRYDLNIKIIEFNDYNLPNEALQDGSLDANVYQHLPYLQAASKAHGYHLKVIGKTFIYPTGIYSKKFKSLAELPEHALIALPNDPSNEARALLLLQKAGLITLHEKQNATIQDIAANPKRLRFKELDAAQLPRVLPDVDAAIINTTFAIPAGLSPKQDALFIENKDSPYANLIVVRSNSTKNPQLELFVKALNSPEVEKKAQELFGDAAIPAWK